MKRLFLTILTLSLFVLTGCSDKAFILMKSVPLTSDNAQFYEQRFEKGQRIYYAIVKPDGFKDDAIKIEIIKKNTKVSNFGYSIAYADNLPIDNTKNYYRDYFVMNSSGLYFMQVFELRRPDKCLARYDFWVN